MNGEKMTEILHEDDPNKEGNLTAEQYYATFYDPGTKGGHEVPKEELEKALKALENK